MLSELQNLLSLNDVPLFGDVVQSIKKQEGFQPFPYDLNGLPHIGYGTLLPITEMEASVLLLIRFGLSVHELEKINIFEKVKNVTAIQVLSHMSYQLGVPKLLQFKKMLDAIYIEDYQKAADEVIDSLLAKQTPERAQMYATILRSIAKNK